MFDFANVLFSGRCNAHCYFCIGERIEKQRRGGNLNEYPPRGLETLIERMRWEEIGQLVITGVNTDPQLYRHEARLLAYLRQTLPAQTQLSLHTNGRLALRKMGTFNCYDRACISWPSFDPNTYRRIMGVAMLCGLEQIVRQASIPIKVSCVLTAENLAEIPVFLRRVSDLGIGRVVLRKAYGERRSWGELLPDLMSEPDDGPDEACKLRARGYHRGNRVYDFDGLQVTLWDFERSTCSSLNLFSSGEISEDYLLVKL